MLALTPNVTNGTSNDVQAGVFGERVSGIEGKTHVCNAMYV